MIRTCSHCGKEFDAIGAAKYCSKECLDLARKIRRNHFSTKDHICPSCGENFNPVNGRQKYCSESCWREANKEKVKEKNYRNAMKYHDKKFFGGNRELALIRDGYRCVKCGSPEDIGVHHIDGTGKKENPNHALENLQTLCNTCHMQEHAKDKIGPKTAYLTTCQYCGNLFDTTPYRVSIGGGKYCSKECKDAGRVVLDKTSDLRPANKPNWFLVNCATCGKEFEVPPYRLKRGKTLYCSRTCRTVAENNKRAKPKPTKPEKPIPREGFKFCIKCGDELPATDEFFHKRTDNGVEKLKNTCKECANKKAMERHETNREDILANNRRNYAETHDNIKPKNRKWYQ